jgi:DNA-binding transcriptional LysR family regulator
MADFDLNDFEWFLVLAREKSFTRAAAQLGIAQSTLSHMIKRLETRMGLRLLARTTRSVALTDAGARLVAAVEPRLNAMKADLAQMMAQTEALSGQVRLTVSDHSLDWVIWPRLAPLLAANPGLKLELHIDSSHRNIVDGGFDAGIRLGEALEKDMIAVRVSPDWRLLTVASPSYFADRTPPQTPRDLMTHNCINFRHSADGGTYAWEFARKGQEMRVRVEGQLTFNSSRAAVQAAIDGHGIAYVPEDLVLAPLAQGTLVACLEDWCPVFPGYFLYYPSRNQNSAVFTAVVAALRVRS